MKTYNYLLAILNLMMLVTIGASPVVDQDDVAQKQRTWNYRAWKNNTQQPYRRQLPHYGKNSGAKWRAYRAGLAAKGRIEYGSYPRKHKRPYPVYKDKQAALPENKEDVTPETAGLSEQEKQTIIKNDIKITMWLTDELFKKITIKDYVTTQNWQEAMVDALTNVYADTTQQFVRTFEPETYSAEGETDNKTINLAIDAFNKAFQKLKDLIQEATDSSQIAIPALKAFMSKETFTALEELRGNTPAEIDFSTFYPSEPAPED